MRTDYPSLYAALETGDRDGQRGKIVRCSATRRELGFIYWTAIGSQVAWHFRTSGLSPASGGETTTERNAVQRLRDLHKQHGDPVSVIAARSQRAPSRPRIGTCTDSPACARRGCDRCEAAYPLLPDDDRAPAPPTTGAPAPPQTGKGAAAPAPPTTTAPATTAPPRPIANTSHVTWTTTNTNHGDIAAAIARGFAKQGEKP